jgi:superfamily II RNA helicase
LQDYERRTAEDLARANESLQRRLTSLQKASEERRENWLAQYKKFKQRLAEVMADYSHTLRQLKPQDNIVVTVDLDYALDDGPQYFVCRVKKQQVDAFNARRLTREQFMKQIAFMEY